MHSLKKPFPIVYNKTFTSANIPLMAYYNYIPPEDMQAIGMPIEEVRLLFKQKQVKFVLYHKRQAGFDSLNNTFLF